jgi:hypothetical protein
MTVPLIIGIAVGSIAACFLLPFLGRIFGASSRSWETVRANGEWQRVVLAEMQQRETECGDTWKVSRN